MKHRYDYRINPQRPDEERIRKHQNFDALLQRYKPIAGQPTAQRRLVRRTLSAAAVLLCLITAYYLFRPSGNFEDMQRGYFASQPFIQRPFEHIQPTFASYSLRNEDGAKIVQPTGSTFSVPPMAFVHQNGQPVTGEVTFYFHEMHDFVDFFLAGIPMSYDSAGAQYTLESAGMIEVYAEQDGERIALARDKSIGVELISRVNVAAGLEVPPAFNIYRLDEKLRNWVYKDIDRMSLLKPPSEMALNETADDGPLSVVRREYLSELRQIEEKRAQRLAAIEAQVPVPQKPLILQKANPADHVFELDFSALNNPNATGQLAETQRELAELYSQYADILWRLSPNSGIAPKQLQEQFAEVTGITIRKDSGSEFQITLAKEGGEVSFLASPVLPGWKYGQAREKFDRDFADWEKKVAEREAQLRQQKQALEAAIAAERKAAEQKLLETEQRLRKGGFYQEATDMLVSRSVVNRFNVSSLGIWNCDRPLPPYVQHIKARFVDQQGQPFEHVTGYLVDKSRNTINRILVRQDAVIRFNYNSENLLWVVGPDGKIALFRTDDFNKIEPDTKEYTFVLTKINIELKDEDDVREVLYL